MIKHYLKVAFRNLIKYKTQSLVSIIGLAVGFTCFALSVLWIRYEMTYDNFHEGADRIYLAGSSFRLYGDGYHGTPTFRLWLRPLPLGMPERKKGRFDKDRPCCYGVYP